MSLNLGGKDGYHQSICGSHHIYMYLKGKSLFICFFFFSSIFFFFFLSWFVSFVPLFSYCVSCEIQTFFLIKKKETHWKSHPWRPNKFSLHSRLFEMCHLIPGGRRRVTNTHFKFDSYVYQCFNKSDWPSQGISKMFFYWEEEETPHVF